MRLLVAGACAALTLTACAPGDGPPAESGGAASAPTSSSGRSSPAEDLPPPEEPPAPVALSQRCESPVGFAIDYPEGWAVNSGETVPECTRFAPDPFRVPPNTDGRVGAITASVEAVPFARIASSQFPEVTSRTETTVDGRRAVRIERVSVGEGLYRAGVRTTSYVIDLGPGDDGPRALVVNTVGLVGFDYDRNVQVLDRMIETLQISVPAAADPGG